MEEKLVKTETELKLDRLYKLLKELESQNG